MSVAPESTKPVRHQAHAARSTKRLALGFLCGLALVAGLSWWYTRGFAANKEGDPSRTGPTATEEATSRDAASTAVRVDVVRPRTGGLTRKTSQPGSIHAFESVDMYAKVSGFLGTQAVDIGAVVKRDQVLAEIASPELEKDVDEAAAAVEQARARATLAEARVATAQAEREAVAASVAQAEADIDQHVARRSLNEKQLERIKGLYARDAIQKGIVEEQQHDLDSALAAERSARVAVLTARAQLAAAAAKIHQALADVAEAKSAVALAEVRLGRSRVMHDYCRIVSPFDGVITARHFHPGAFIRSAADGSSSPLLTVMRTDRMRVVVQVPDLDVALLDVGDPATVLIDAIKGQTFTGPVSRLARAENPTTRTMRVEIDLENPSGLLFEGMYGRATIELRPPSKGLAIPALCIVGHSSAGRAKVYVVRDGRIRSVDVTVGDDDGTTTEVLSGLAPDDPVVLNPRGVTEDGTPVVANLIP